MIDERELADDLALSHQRDDAFFAAIRRNRDFDQAFLDAIAAIAAVAGHKELFPSLGGVLGTGWRTIASWSIAAMIGSSESVVIGSSLVG